MTCKLLFVSRKQRVTFSCRDNNFRTRAWDAKIPPRAQHKLDAHTNARRRIAFLKRRELVSETLAKPDTNEDRRIVIVIVIVCPGDRVRTYSFWDLQNGATGTN